MQNRVHSVVVQVCLALACALGAGFSGDMLARSAGHAGHHGRHSRASQHRGTRAGGRDSQGDHAQEVELVQDIHASATDSAHHSIAVAILPRLPDLTFAWTDLGLAPVSRAGFTPTVVELHLPARAPPTV